MSGLFVGLVIGVVVGVVAEDRFDLVFRIKRWAKDL